VYTSNNSRPPTGPLRLPPSPRAGRECHRVLNALANLPKSAEPRGRARSETRALEALALAEAEIVFCTMSAAGEKALREVPGGFETVLLDEAAQATELAALVPMSLGARLVCLVGDPRQLPATVLSEAAKRRGYARSLFERLEQLGRPVLMLSTQYRMHGAIRQFPSLHFYGGLLRDAPSITHMMRQCPGSEGGAPSYLSGAAGCQPERRAGGGGAVGRLAPYLFFSLLGGRQDASDSSRSHSNEGEAAVCVGLLLALWMRQARQPHGWGELYKRVVLLTPYTRQQRVLHSLLDRVCEALDLPADGVLVSSIDAFQGREADVVILSCVRAGPKQASIGFLKDEQRLNVALTRARHALYVVGAEESLSDGSRDWRALLEDARRRSCLCSLGLARQAAEAARAAREAAGPARAARGAAEAAAGRLRPQAEMAAQAAREAAASELRQVSNQFKRLAELLLAKIPETLLDGTREGDAAPRPPQLTELLPLPGRPGLNSPQRTPLRA